MSPDEMRVKIAEALGTHQVKVMPFDGGTMTHVTDCNGRIWAIRELDGGPVTQSIPIGFDPIPLYDQDLNACHEMERVGLVTPELRKAYVNALDVITGANNQDSWSECLYCGFTATALQRCEAFLRTKKLYED